MSTLALYLILLKAVATSFSGFGSLPVLREELVVRRQVLTDDALQRSVLVARMTPGPMGVYVISVGYHLDGLRGAAAGWAALATPAILILPLLALTQRLLGSARIRAAIGSLILASAILLVQTAYDLAIRLPSAFVTLVNNRGGLLM